MGNEGACLVKLQRGWEDNKTREQGEGMIMKMQRRNLEDDGNGSTDNHNDEDNCQGHSTLDTPSELKTHKSS